MDVEAHRQVVEYDIEIQWGIAEYCNFAAYQNTMRIPEEVGPRHSVRKILLESDHTVRLV